MYCMDFYRSFFSVPSDRIHAFVLIDGLGMNMMDRVSPDSWAARTFRGEMKSVYPSTTAVALSSISSLAEPGDLGVTGWTTWLPRSERRVNVLLGKTAGGKIEDPTVVEESLLVESRFASDSAVIIEPAPFTTQSYGQWTTGGGTAKVYGFRYGDDWDNKEAPDHWSKVFAQAISEARPGSLLYLYLPMVDSSSHSFGWDAAETEATLKSIDGDLSAICSGLQKGKTPVSIAATADHGLINIPRERYFHIDGDTPWLAFLDAPFSGEGRNPVFHVKPGMENEFSEAFSNSPEGQFFDLHTPEELIDKGFFPGGISPGARERWGTYVGLANCPAYLELIDWGKPPKNFIAVHGGDDPGERRVPLLQWNNGL